MEEKDTIFAEYYNVITLSYLWWCAVFVLMFVLDKSSLIADMDSLGANIFMLISTLLLAFKAQISVALLEDFFTLTLRLRVMLCLECLLSLVVFCIVYYSQFQTF